MPNRTRLQTSARTGTARTRQLLRVRLAHERAATKLLKLERARELIGDARREYAAAHAELFSLLRTTGAPSPAGARLPHPDAVAPSDPSA